MDPLAGLPLRQVDPSAGRPVLQIGVRDLYITGDLVAEAQIFVNVGRHHLGCRNGLDDRGRSAGTVAAGKDARHVFKVSCAPGDDLSSLDRDPCLFKMAGFDILADGPDQHIAGDIHVRLSRGLDPGAAVLYGADHLGRGPDPPDPSVLIHIDGGRCL